MNEHITLSVQALCIFMVTCIIGGTFGGVWVGIRIGKEWLRARSGKTFAKTELHRLARHMEIHYPHVRDEGGLVVDKAIKLMR